MSHTIMNNFQAYKADFKKETGLDVAQNMGAYIAYVNARSSDVTAQFLSAILNEVGNWHGENNNVNSPVVQGIHKILTELEKKK